MLIRSLLVITLYLSATRQGVASGADSGRYAFDAKKAKEGEFKPRPRASLIKLFDLINKSHHQHGVQKFDRGPTLQMQILICYFPSLFMY